MEEAIFLPVLSHFENENFWTASGGRMRYRVDPVKGDEENPPSLTAQVWEGPWRLQDSTVEETKSFSMTEEGLEELRSWVLVWQETINARPPRSMKETLQARDARRAELEAQSKEE
ncbi:hypothetical protein B5E56_04025 [Flavonifractor sp. An112]|uniref:hypothetical protein n=1 Tax=Flavonifractor sp. An112 TaxID=1965544 RepID=UPI000B37D0FA|nr:hypothetical protein [Flavonifractor sp. An112]OUQ61285.1 hypothetical protein B5E56_04025 [Flavonifractor sp. An112]